MEITKSINQYKIFAGLVNFFIKLFLYIVRLANRSFAYKKGNVVVICLHKLGDTIFTIPAIKEIKKYYSGEKIIIVCYPEVVPIYKLEFSDLIYCTIDHDEFYFHNRIAGTSARKILKSQRPGTIFDLTGVMTSATLIFNSRAKEIIGMNRGQFKTIYDYYSPVRRTPHLMDRYLDAVAVKIPNIIRKEIKNFQATINREGKIIIHPFGGWRAKEWNLNKFVDLAIKLNEEYEVCLISPDEGISTDIIKLLYKDKIGVVQTATIPELIDQIKQCSIFIGNDSGPLYIASLLGKPTFTIYGPTNSEFSKPLGEHHNYINKSIKCSPQKDGQYCFTVGGQSGCPAFQCMNLLKFEEVYNSIFPFVQKYCKPKAHVI
jgi:lipopolysaccharide heptosyltransferase II